jgi:hypothetical protein
MARRLTKTAKIQALVDRPGTAGEQQAAAGALARVSSKALAPSSGHEPLSDGIIKRLLAPEKGNRVYWDAALGGFGVRVTAGGARSFVLDYRVKGSGRQRRITIGGFPNWTTGAARAKARELRRRIDSGRTRWPISMKPGRRRPWPNSPIASSASICRASVPGRRLHTSAH